MREIIENIYKTLDAEIEKGKRYTPFTFPILEPALEKHVIRELTEEEYAFLQAKIQARIVAENMYNRVKLLDALGQYEQIAAQAKQNEIIRFKSEMLDNLFFWMMNESTGWKYSSLIQRVNAEGKHVLVGLEDKDAREFHGQKEEAEKLEPQSASNLIN